MGDWNNEGPVDPQAGRPLWDEDEPFIEPPPPSGRGAGAGYGAPAGSGYGSDTNQGLGAGAAPTFTASDWDDEPASATMADAPTHQMPVVPPEPPAEPPVRRSRPAPPPRPSSRALWAYAIAGLAVGVLIGVGLLTWQRMAMLSDQRALETKLSAAEASATVASEEAASLQAKLTDAEASVSALAAEKSKLASDLAAANAALADANAKLADAAKTLTITERSVSPSPVVKEKPLTLEAKVKGKADKVQMKIVGLAPVSFTKYYTLSKVSTSGGIETWRKTITAPPTVGTYRYYATALIGTKSFDMPGVSAWAFEVTAGP